MTHTAPATWAGRKQKDKLYNKTLGQEWVTDGKAEPQKHGRINAR